VSERAEFQLLTTQTETLFVHNTLDRLVMTNEPNGRTAPRVFIGRSAGGDVIRFRYDVPTSLKAELAELAGLLPPYRHGPSSGEFNPIIEALARYQPVETVFEGPAFRFPPEIDLPPGVARITPLNVHLLPEHFDLRDEIVERQPCYAVVADGVPVSLAYTSRRSQWAAEVGTNTTEEHRGRGYAATAVTAWAAETRARGRIPLYSTWWENAASRALARKLRLIPYAVDFHAR